MDNEQVLFVENIYARYAYKLESMCLRYVCYKEEYREIVDDSVQKTFIIAFEKYDELKELDYVESWLFQTCIHRLTTALKTYRRRKKYLVPFDAQMGLKLTQDEIINGINDFVDRISNQELIERVFNALNDREYDIADKYFIQGWSLEEIATNDQTSIGAIKAVIARLRVKARRIVQSEKKYFLILPYLFFLIRAYKK